MSNTILQTNSLLISPNFFYGCGGVVRKIAEKKNIPEKSLCYAVYRNGKWFVYSKTYKLAKLYLTKKWVHKHVPGFCKDSEAISEYEQTPPLLELEEGSQWLDEDGEPYKIKMRGERKVNSIYFSAKDVADIFRMKTLDNTLRHPKSTYSKGKHYKLFIQKNSEKLTSTSNKKFIYLTYRGMIKVMFSHNTPEAESFQDWCLNVLFTHQFGDYSEKKKLASKLIGCDTLTVHKMLRTSVGKLSCVYLFELKSGEPAKKEIIVKFGRTKDLDRRTKEHFATYGEISLIYYTYIDPTWVVEAEDRIRQFFKAYRHRVSANNSKSVNRLSNSPPKGEEIELAKIPVKLLYTDVKKLFEECMKEYGGIYNELVRKCESKMESLRHTLDKKEQEIMHLQDKINMQKKMIRVLKHK